MHHGRAGRITVVRKGVRFGQQPASGRAGRDLAGGEHEPLRHRAQRFVQVTGVVDPDRQRFAGRGEYPGDLRRVAHIPAAGAEAARHLRVGLVDGAADDSGEFDERLFEQRIVFRRERRILPESGGQRLPVVSRALFAVEAREVQRAEAAVPAGQQPEVVVDHQEIRPQRREAADRVPDAGAERFVEPGRTYTAALRREERCAGIPKACSAPIRGRWSPGSGFRPACRFCRVRRGTVRSVRRGPSLYPPADSPPARASG